MTKFLEKATIYSAAGDLAVVVYVKERSMPHTSPARSDILEEPITMILILEKAKGSTITTSELGGAGKVKSCIYW